MIGIDRPLSRNPWEVSAWVLGKFSGEDMSKIDQEVFPNAKKMLEQWMEK